MKKLVYIMLCMGWVAAASGNPATPMEGGRFDLTDLIQQKQVRFMVLVTPHKTCFKVDDQKYLMDPENTDDLYIRLIAPHSGTFAVDDIRYNQHRRNGLPINKDGEIFGKRYGPLPSTYILKPGWRADAVPKLGPPKDCPPQPSPVPAPAAVLLGSSGMLLVGWLRQRGKFS